MAQRKPPKDDAQLQLFSAIFTDIVTRDAQDTMAVPFLALSKSPRFEPLEYEDAERGIHVMVTGGKPWGIANIYDWDLMMWLMSQIRHALDLGREVSPKIGFHAYSFLKDARRATGGAQYKRLEDSITRLHNTTVSTSIRAANGKKELFHWIERSTLMKNEDGQTCYAIVQLPDWLFRAVCDHHEVLSLHRDYLLLTGGLERWLYRFVRRAAGKDSWEWKFKTLHKRSGSTQRFSDFSRDLRKIIKGKELLGYQLSEFRKRSSQNPFLRADRISEASKKEPEAVRATENVDFLSEPQKLMRLRPRTYKEAERLAPGYDVSLLEAQWRHASTKNGLLPRDPDLMFLSWCRAVSEKTPVVARPVTGRSSESPNQIRIEEARQKKEEEERETIDSYLRKCSASEKEALEAAAVENGGKFDAEQYRTRPPTSTTFKVVRQRLIDAEVLRRVAGHL